MVPVVPVAPVDPVDPVAPVCPSNELIEEIYKPDFDGFITSFDAFKIIVLGWLATEPIVPITILSFILIVPSGDKNRYLSSFGLVK